MHHFAYRGGVLHAEDVSLAALADAVGTPFYCYATATLERHYRVLQQAFAGLDTLICYALKANSNQAVIATLARLGAGMDVVSEGELRRALAAGVPGGPHHLRRRRQDACGDGLRPAGGHPRLQRGVGGRARRAERGRRGPRPHRAHRACASTPTSMPRRTPRSPPAGPRTSSACPTTMRRASMPRPPSCPASRSPASTCTSAARSPTLSPSATPSR